MEIGPATLLFLLVVFAGGTAVMMIMMGKWLDLTGYRYKLETQRNAMNHIQLIVSNSPIVEKKTDEPDKLILDADAVNSFQTEFEITDPDNPSSQHESWGKCCDFLDFDHNLTVVEIRDPNDPDDDIIHEFGNLVFKEESECYPERVKGIADVPVVISMDGMNDPGVAVVEMSRTPLSELSFWLSQAFMRASWDDYWMLYPEEKTYTVFVALDPEIRRISIHPVDESHRRVCTHIDRDGDGVIDVFACKNFVFIRRTNPSDRNIVWDPDDSLVYTGDCLNVVISVEKVDDTRTVSIIYPGM